MDFDYDEDIEAMENRESGGCMSLLITIVVIFILLFIFMHSK